MYNIPYYHLLLASSNGQSVNFEIHVIMHYVYDGVDDKETDRVSVYPNPMRDVFFVGIDNDSSVQRVEVFNVTGQRVITSTETEINVSELESGMYVVRITADDRTVIRHIVKQ